MNKRELDEALQKRVIPKSILFYGDNEYSVSSYAKKCALSVGNEDEIKRFYFSEFDLEYVLELVSSSSLFGDKNIVIAKLDKKIAKDDLIALLKSVAKNESSYLFIEFYGDNSDAKIMASYFTKELKAESIRFFEPHANEVIEIILKKAKELKLELTKNEIIELYKSYDGNLALIIGELEKLSIGVQSGLQINDLLCSLGLRKIDDLLFELFEKKDVKENFLMLLQEEVFEVELINSMLNFVYRILLFRLYIKIYGFIDSQDILGYTLPKNIQDRISHLATTLKESKLIEILELLLKTQLELKGEPSNSKDAIFLSTLIKIQALLK